MNFLNRLVYEGVPAQVTAATATSTMPSSGTTSRTMMNDNPQSAAAYAGLSLS